MPKVGERWRWSYCSDGTEADGSPAWCCGSGPGGAVVTDVVPGNRVTYQATVWVQVVTDDGDYDEWEYQGADPVVRAEKM